MVLVGKGRRSRIQAVVGTFAGCGNTQQQGSSAAGSSAAGGKITVKDLTGKEFTFDKPLDKVAIQWSGSGGPFMIMAALYGKDFVNHIAAMDDGLVKNRVRIHKYDDDSVCAIKIVKPIENDSLVRLQEKSAHAEELRKKRREAEKKAREAAKRSLPK